MTDQEQFKIMNELLYFSSFDLMIKVEYNKESNSLRYATHRKITLEERFAVEQHVLTKVALKTDFYKIKPSLFVYLGPDKRVARHLEVYRLKSMLKTLIAKTKDIKSSVDGLINQSMQNYYFEQIGDIILAVRKQLDDGQENYDRLEIQNKMEELIKAYNIYSDRKVTFDEVIPTELQPYLNISTKHHLGDTA